MHVPLSSPASLVSVTIAHVVTVAVARPPPSLPLLLPPSPPPSSLHDTFVATLFWPPLPSLSAVATATTNANISTAVTVNAATAASILTNVSLCFCQYPHHRFRMCRSHHDCRFCHSCYRSLLDCCLTHRCHFSADSFANAATSQCAFASHSPGWLSRGFASRRNLLTRHCLSTRRLVVVSPLVAPPSHLPRLVVALPLIAPPLTPLTPSRLLLRIPHPPPEGFSFGR